MAVLDSRTLLAGGICADERARVLAPVRRAPDPRQAGGARGARAEERAALARRFALVRIDRLEAEVRLERDGEAVNATGAAARRDRAELRGFGRGPPVAIDEPLAFRFVPETAPPADEEIELDADELDEIESLRGHAFDLGEAVAQSLALAIDPFAVGPEAERVRKRGGAARRGERAGRLRRWRR